MSKTSHTPGPWVAEPNGGRGSWVKGSNGEWAALACGMLDSTAEANARFIAAAPELLEQAEFTDEEIGKHMAAIEAGEYEPALIVGILCDIQNRARTAIAKVKGT